MHGVLMPISRCPFGTPSFSIVQCRYPATSIHLDATGYTGSAWRQSAQPLRGTTVATVIYLILCVVFIFVTIPLAIVRFMDWLGGGGRAPKLPGRPPERMYLRR
jgi:hypothetical protein